MRIIICLLVAIAVAFWVFNRRSHRSSAPPPLRDAAAQISAQAKAIVAEAQATAADAIRTQSTKAEPSAINRILAGEKVREQPVGAAQPAPRPTNSTYDRILRGERFTENKRPAAP